MDVMAYKQAVSDALHQQLIVDALDRKISRLTAERETEGEVLAKLQERVLTMEARNVVAS